MENGNSIAGGGGKGSARSASNAKKQSIVPMLPLAGGGAGGVSQKQPLPLQLDLPFVQEEGSHDLKDAQMTHVPFQTSGGEAGRPFISLYLSPEKRPAAGDAGVANDLV